MSANLELTDANAGYRWLESEHLDLCFYNVPRRFPWPEEEPETIDVAKDFPFHILFRAIRRLPLEKSWHYNVWKHLITIFEDSKPLNDAMERGQFREAEKILYRLKKLHPSCPFIHYTLGFLDRQQEQWETAAEHYQNAAALAPNLEYVWMRLGGVLEELDQDRAAIAAYRQALRLLPGHAHALASLERLGQVAFLTVGQDGERTQKHVEKEEYREIIRAEQKRLAGDPDGLFALAEEIYEGGFCREFALDPLGDILALAPNHIPALCYLGAILRIRRRFTEAAAAMHRAIAAAPEEPWPHFELAAIAQEQDQREQALVHLERCLQLNPNLEAALRLRYHADMHLSNGRKEELLAAFGREKSSWRALIMASEHALGRGECYAQALQEGMNYAAEAYRLFPHQREVLLHYTTALAAHGEHEWVAALARPKLQAGEQDPLLRWHYARALHAMRLPDLAVQELRAALAGQLPEEWQDSFREQLDRWTGLIARADVSLEIHGEVDEAAAAASATLVPSPLFGPNKSDDETRSKPVLRRAIHLLRDNQPAGQVFPAAVPLGQRHRLQIEFKKPRDTARIQLQHGREAAPDLPPRNLGVFEMTGIDPAQLPDQPPYFHLLLHSSGHMEAAASQGDRRLPVTWSLYARPALDENDHP